MNIDLRTIFPPVMALLILIVIGVQTSEALKDVGRRTAKVPKVAPADPYAGLDLQIVRAQQPVDLNSLRDPFSTVTTARPVATRPTTRRTQQVVIVPAPRPIVTAIVNDADPRALISYEGRNYSVKTGDLFAEFRVVSITGDRVLLDGPGGMLVLRRPIKGD